MMVAWLQVFYLAHFADQVLGGPPAWKTLGLLATAIRLVLSTAEVYHLPLVLVLSGLGSVSYFFCLAAATVVHWLSRAES